MRTGKNAGMGSCGQYFSTWEFVYSLTRDLSIYTLYPMTREEFTCALDAFTLYTNMLAQWSYFYYPWGIGTACFRFDDAHRVYKAQD